MLACAFLHSKHLTNMQMHILVVFLLIQASFGFDLWKGFDKATTTPQYTWDGGQFGMTWKIDNDVLTLTMFGQTNGWISCGICQGTSSMSNCDFWTGWVSDSDNSVVLLDTWSTGNSRPKTDSHNDLTLINGTQSGGKTSITFSRPLKTGDSKQDTDITNTLLSLGWATYTKDGSSPTKYSQHNKAGFIYVNFFTGATAAVSKIDSGMLLGIIVVGFLLAWGLVHTSRKIYKTYEKYQSKKELEAGAGTTVMAIDANPTTDIPLQEVSVQKSHYVKNEADLQHAAPKETTVGCFNVLEGFLSRKIPFSDVPVGMVVLLIAYIGVNIGCLFYSNNKFSLKVGDILAANIFFVTIPATRNSALVYFLGVPFDRTIRFHRWLGRFTLVLAIIHFALTLADWKTKSEIASQVKLITNIYGLIALGVLLLIFITSLNWIRRKGFEFFYFVHFVFILFWIFAFLHNEKLRPWVGATVAIYVFDKLVRLVWGTLPQKTTDFKIKGSGKDKILQIRVKKNELAALLHMYEVGQYVFVNFPQVSMFEWHPFSVSSGPGETTLEINVKAIGGYTEKLIEHASKESSLTVRVEGPYGSLNVNYRRYPVVVLVGGGIGLTPLLGMLKDLAGTGKLDPHYFGGKSFVRKLHFIWVVPSMSVYEWFGSEIQEAIQVLGHTGTEVSATIYATREKSVDNNNALLRAGRPNIKEIFKGIMTDAHELPVGVFVCGPQPMMEDVWEAVNIHRTKGETIHFHKETFEL